MNTLGIEDARGLTVTSRLKWEERTTWYGFPNIGSRGALH